MSTYDIIYNSKILIFQVRFNVNVNGEAINREKFENMDPRRRGKMMRQKEVAMSFDLTTNQPRHFEKVGMDLKTFDEITRSDYNMNKGPATKVTIGGLTCTFHPTPVGNILLTRSGTRVNKRLESGIKCLPPELQNPTRTPSPNANRKFKREISYLDSLDCREEQSTSAASENKRLPSVSETVSVESGDVPTSCYTMCKGPRVKTNKFIQQRAQKSRYYNQTVKLIRFAKNTISQYHK